MPFEPLQQEPRIQQRWMEAGARVDPAPYLATLQIVPAPVTPAPWLLEAIGG